MSDRDFDFTNEIDEADWSMVKDHHGRGALFLVDDSLKLDQVARAMARDEVKLVDQWLLSGQLRKATEQEIQLWEADPHHKRFMFIIVQPYVIVQVKTTVLQ